MQSNDPSARNVELLSSDRPFSGFLRISRHSFRYRRQDGEWSHRLSREVCERSPAAAVLPYHPASDSVMLLEQFRLPAWLAGMSGWQIEVVAGILENQQDEEQTALRESREEAGLDITALWPINRVLPSPGGCDEVITLYLGRIDTPGKDGLYGLEAEDEDIRAFVLPFEEAYRMLEAGEIENGTAWMALAWLKLHRDEVQRCWKT